MSSNNGPPALDRKAIFYMSLLALQFGMQPALTRKFTPDGICRSTVILMQEALKFVIGFIMLNLSGELSVALQGTSFKMYGSVCMVCTALNEQYSTGM
jgi:hypothetical protein